MKKLIYNLCKYASFNFSESQFLIFNFYINKFNNKYIIIFYMNKFILTNFVLTNFYVNNFQYLKIFHNFIINNRKIYVFFINHFKAISISTS